MSTKARSGNGIEQMAKQAVRQSKEWSIAIREANMSSLIETLKWNPEMTSMFEPWLEMTRTMHDNWLDLWEHQTNGVIEHTAQMAEQGARMLRSPLFYQSPFTRPM